MMMAKREEGGHVNNSRLESELDQHEREREREKGNEQLTKRWTKITNGGRFRFALYRSKCAFLRGLPPLARPAFFSP